MIAYAQECSKCAFTNINLLNPPCAVCTIIILTKHVSLECKPPREQVWCFLFTAALPQPTTVLGTWQAHNTH